MVDALRGIKKELTEAQKRKEEEEKRRRKEKAEAESFEKMMQEEGTKRI